MKIKLIACEVLTRELGLVTAQSKHIFDTAFLPFGLHSTPDKLRTTIQSEIDSAEGGGYDFIALGYCLCSRGTMDIIARSVPVLIPRGHDCITMFLGSRARYADEFGSHPGTYYYSPGWIERSDGDVEQGNITAKKDRETNERYEEYVRKYGEDNAKFLIEQETLWLANYTRAALIDMGIGDIKAYKDFVKNVASSHGWECSELDGDWSLIKKLADGDWSDEDFLSVKPGERTVETFDDRIIASHE